jgi:hypothetical protein
MKSKFAPRLALSVLFILPSLAFSACAAGPEASVVHGALDARVGGPDFDTCRSARQAAELVRQMQMPEGGLPLAIPAECEFGPAAKKQAATSREMKSYVERPIFDHSPG